jgi:hypothetical protein
LEYSNLGRRLPFLVSGATEEDKEVLYNTYFINNFNFRSKTKSKCKSSAMPCFRNKKMGVSPVVAVYLEEYRHLTCTCAFFGKELCAKVGA